MAIQQALNGNVRINTSDVLKQPVCGALLYCFGLCFLNKLQLPHAGDKGIEYLVKIKGCGVCLCYYFEAKTFIWKLQLSASSDLTCKY